MRLPMELISGELLLEALYNEHIIDKKQYDRIDDMYINHRNENNYVILSLDELYQFIDEDRITDAKNLIITKSGLNNLNNCYIAI